MKVILGVLLGGAIGFAIAYFNKCSSEACPLIRNRWVSAGYGAAVGFMLTMS